MDHKYGSDVNGNVFDGLMTQLQAFRESDSARDTLLQELMQGYQVLRQRLTEKDDDLQAEVESRRLLQANMRETKKELQYLRQQTEGNLYSLTLIDGDGVIFQDALLQNGADGGGEAAYLLHKCIKEHLHDLYEDSHSWSNIVYVAANFDGLSRKLASVGILKSPQEIHSFARSFSCSQPMFNLIDVGMGKERADHKIKEMFRLFINNVQCKHIIFGGCHDNGYLPNLEPYKRDDNISRRITLLASIPAERGFLDLGFRITEFPSVFRGTPLPENRYVALPLRSHSNSGPIGSEDSSNGGIHSASQDRESPSSTLAHTTSRDEHLRSDFIPRATPVVPPATPATAPSSTLVPSTYARASSITGSPETRTINIAPTKSIGNRKAIYLNAEQQRIDAVLPKVDELAHKALAARIKHGKVCNNYHLLGSCPNGKSCDYSHAPKLSNPELGALRIKARERQCFHKSQCRSVDCMSGHHCPRGEACESDWCNFSDPLHYIDTKIKLREFEDGDVEVVM